MGLSHFSSSFTWQGIFFSNHHFQHPREGTCQALALFFFSFPSGGKMLELRWECMAIGNIGQVQLAVVCITCFMVNRRGFYVGLGLTHWKLSAREEFAFSPRVTWAQSQRSRRPCFHSFLWGMLFSGSWCVRDTALGACWLPGGGVSAWCPACHTAS